MRKIGIICLALIMALGALGIGYAAWTDTVTIDGTVNTGDVDLVVKKYSGTYVWKISTGDEIFVESGWMGDIGNPANITDVVDAFPNDGQADIDPVGSATAAQGTTPDDITVTFDNMFPCVNFTADFLLHYAGSIPVKVKVSNVAVHNITGATATIKYYESDAAGAQGAEITVPVGMQLHECDYILVVITIHLEQLQTNMNQNGTVSGTITVQQWNEP